MSVPESTFNAVAQAGHFQAGCLAVFAPVALTHDLWWGVLGAAMIVAFAAGKEFWWDRLYESAPVRGSGWQDFAFYCLGPPPCLLLCWLTRAM